MKHGRSEPQCLRFGPRQATTRHIGGIAYQGHDVAVQQHMHSCSQRFAYETCDAKPDVGYSRPLKLRSVVQEKAHLLQFCTVYI